LSIPSKTFNLMSVGVPILGISPDQSALSELIHSEEIGKSFNSKSPESMIMFIEQLYENPDLHNKLSIKSKMASNKFTVKNTESYLADVS
jgi:glycosyltransferase involved in cell wall biosynthesis